jgi:hypothetical protein
MQVVSHDVTWLLSHIRVLSSELPESAGATPTPAVHVGALKRAVSRLVFVTVTVRTPRYRQLTPIASRTWLPFTPMLSYASPALYCQLEARHPQRTATRVFDHPDNNSGSPPSAHRSDVSDLSPGDIVNIAGPQSIYDLIRGIVSTILEGLPYIP